MRGGGYFAWEKYIFALTPCFATLLQRRITARRDQGGKQRLMREPQSETVVLREAMRRVSSLPEGHAVAPPSHASPSKPNPPLRLHAWPQIPAEVEFLPQLQPKRRSPKPLPLPSEGTWDASCKMDDRCIPYYDALTDRHNRYVRTQSFRKHYQGYLEMRSDARIARSHSLATKLFRASVGELHSSSAPHLPVAGMGGLPNLEVATVITPPTPTRTHTHPHPPTPHPPTRDRPTPTRHPHPHRPTLDRPTPTPAARHPSPLLLLAAHLFCRPWDAAQGDRRARALPEPAARAAQARTARGEGSR